MTVSHGAPGTSAPARDDEALSERTHDAVARAARILEGRTIVALTGAGISTDSGIPDYRGDGAPRRSPMTFRSFVDDPLSHRRYWAGSQAGWRRLRAVAPNAGHRALARLERGGILNGVVTQNVDALHERAGTRRLVELHGTMHRVRCLACGQVFSREEVSDYSGLVAPRCTVCRGMLKPDVVFFGELVPRLVFDAASALVAEADALLVAGSSLAVNSGVRLVERARRRGLPIVIVNRGATRSDGAAAVTIDGGTSPVLCALTERLLPASSAGTGAAGPTSPS